MKKLEEHLDNRIGDLEELKGKGEITKNGKGQLIAFKSIKQKL